MEELIDENCQAELHDFQSGKPCQAVKDDESGSARFEASEVPYLPSDEASPANNLMLGCS